MSKRKRCRPEDVARKFIQNKCDPEWIAERFIDPFIGNCKVHLYIDYEK